MNDQAIELIRKNLRGRKLVLRWKHEETEQILLERLGLVPSFYVTKNKKYIDQKTTFPESVLKNRSDEFFLVISPSLKWNQKADDRYREMGYQRGQDTAWLSPIPQKKTQKKKDSSKENKTKTKTKFFTLSWKSDKEAMGFDIYETINGERQHLVRIYEPETLEIEIPVEGRDRDFSVISFTNEKGTIIHRNTQQVYYKNG